MSTVYRSGQASGLSLRDAAQRRTSRWRMVRRAVRLYRWRWESKTMLSSLALVVASDALRGNYGIALVVAAVIVASLLLEAYVMRRDFRRHVGRAMYRYWSRSSARRLPTMPPCDAGLRS